jgi:hypothetical protein
LQFLVAEFAGGFSIAKQHAADRKVVEMIAAPPHRGLDHGMQVSERERSRDDDTSPDRRVCVDQRDGDADDKALHAANLFAVIFHIQGSNSSILLIG